MSWTKKWKMQNASVGVEIAVVVFRIVDSVVVSSLVAHCLCPVDVVVLAESDGFDSAVADTHASCPNLKEQTPSEAPTRIAFPSADSLRRSK